MTREKNELSDAPENDPTKNVTWEWWNEKSNLLCHFQVVYVTYYISLSAQLYLLNEREELMDVLLRKWLSEEDPLMPLIAAVTLRWDGGKAPGSGMGWPG